MNRSILIVICDFIITSMIYLNGGFSAIESKPYDGRPADRSTMNIIAKQLDAHRAALEQARSELIAQHAAVQDSEKKARELERITSELASTRARLEYIQRKNSLTEENAGVMTKADIQKELADEILHKNMAQAKFELLQQQLEAAKDSQVRSDDNFKAMQRQNNELIKQQAELIRSNASMMQAKEAQLREQGEALAASQQNVARLNERLSGQSSQFKQALQQKDLLLKQRAEELRHKDAEIAKRNQQLGDAGSQLQQTQKQLSATANELTGVKKDLERTQGELDNTRNSIKKLEEKQQQELKAAEQRYISNHNRQQKNMDVLRGELRDVRKQHEAAKKENADQRAALAQERERKLASERALAETKDKLSRSNDDLKKMSQQYSQAQGRVSSMQKVVENSALKIADLNRRQQEQQLELEELRKINQQLNHQTDQLKDADVKLKAAEKELAYLRSDVAKVRHTEALVELKMSLKQGRSLGLTRQVGTTNMLPVLKIGNGCYVATALENLIRQGNSDAPLSNIASLSFVAGKPNSSGKLLPGPILLEKNDTRVAFMAVSPISNVKPLPVITRSELWREHSSLELYLFKAGKLAGAKLVNRCRWGVGNDRYIYVTNNESRAANEVKAEVGDVLLTRQGFCAGVVVAVNEQEACCYVFESEPKINNMFKIEFGSRQDGHSAFTKSLNHWFEQNSRLNKK